jgi:hypothetical protein
MWKDSQIIFNNATIIEPIIGGEESVTQELKLPEIKKRVADNKASVIYGSTKKQPKMPPIVYENPALIEFCNDPVFTAADSNLDGSQILIFKKDKYFLMTGLQKIIIIIIIKTSTRISILNSRNFWCFKINVQFIHLSSRNLKFLLLASILY